MWSMGPSAWRYLEKSCKWPCTKRPLRGPRIAAIAAEASVSPRPIRAGTGPATAAGHRGGVQGPPKRQRPDEYLGPVRAT
jgi:hypothetical protein